MMPCGRGEGCKGDVRFLVAQWLQAYLPDKGAWCASMVLTVHQSVMVRLKPKGLGRVLLAATLLSLTGGCLGGFGKGDEASRVFVLSLAFAEVAAQRLFVEAGRPIPKGMVGIAPGDTSAQEMNGHLPPCFIYGAPNWTVGEQGACLTGLYWVTSESKIECSYFRRDICNAVNVPMDIFENPRFIQIMTDYASNMCKFLNDYQESSVPAAARQGHRPRQLSYALALERSLVCTNGEDHPFVKEDSRNFWRRMRPLILVRSRDSTIAKEIELNLRFQNL